MPKLLELGVFLISVGSLAVALYHCKKFHEIYYRDAGTVWIYEPYALFSSNVSDECRYHRRRLIPALVIFFTIWALLIIFVVSFGERVPSRRSGSLTPTLTAAHCP